MKVLISLIACSFSLNGVSRQEIDRDIWQWLLYSIKQEYYDPHYDTNSYVASASILHEQEVTYTEKRLNFCAAQFSNNYSKNIPSNCIPKIAVCISGGGLRAMVGGLGFLQALHDEGIFDLTCYVSGLSGSTWAISGWLESKMSFQEYLTVLKERLSIGLLKSVDMKTVMQEILKKLSYDQQISLDDMWGSLIAQKILLNSQKKDLSKITLCNYSELPADGSLPIPIYSSVMIVPNKLSSAAQQYEWIEWSPWSVRSAYLGTQISLSSLGREFNNGMQVCYAPVASVSFGLGVWGSAMSIDAQDLMVDIGQSFNSYEQQILNSLLNELQSNSFLDEATSIRMFPAQIPNWNHHLAQLVMSDYSELTVMDAGILCNIPLPPVLDQLRAADIIIVVDLSWSQEIGSELLCAQEYAQKNNVPFPTLNTENFNNICSIHQENGAPTIIYFPMVANSDYCNGWDPFQDEFTHTFNLRYSPEQIDKMSGYMYTACCQNIQKIWTVIDQYCAKY